jgi:hypothetical protein
MAARASNPANRSRFFGEDSSDESRAASDAEGAAEAPAAAGAKAPRAAPAAAKPANRFQLVESESESDDDKKGIRGPQNKFEQLNACIASIRNEVERSNWVETDDRAWRGEGAGRVARRDVSAAKADTFGPMWTCGRLRASI